LLDEVLRSFAWRAHRHALKAKGKIAWDSINRQLTSEPTIKDRQTQRFSIHPKSRV